MKSACTIPFKVVRFVVVAAEGDPRSFTLEADADACARSAADCWGWADLYRVVGEPATDIWLRPELLVGYERGEAEESALAS